LQAALDEGRCGVQRPGRDYRNRHGPVRQRHVTARGGSARPARFAPRGPFLEHQQHPPPPNPSIMPDQPRVIISGFGDEASYYKTAHEQFSAFSALGLEYYSLRFIDVGNGIKNVMELSKSEVTKLRHLE